MSDLKQITTLEDLAVVHPYYCNTSNFFNNDATGHFETCKEFLENFGDMDIDMNHCFRWDVALKEESQPELGYKAYVFLILQRKGIFTPVTIDSISEEDVEAFVAYLQKHADHHKMMWQPFV